MPLTGCWINELRSVMYLKEHPDGTLTGKYRSLAGRDPHTRPLAGRSSPAESGKQLLGFAVRFHIDDPGGPGNGHFSVCTWSGWERDDEITTHWLLTRSLLNPDDEWASTLIGEDTFERVSDEEGREEFVDSDIETLKTSLRTARAKRKK